MRGLMRMLFMFAPMIIRQVQKYQRNKQRQGYQNDRRRGNPNDRSYPSRDQAPREEPRQRRRVQETTPPPPPKMSEEERNFRLKEDEIMLDNDTVKDYKGSHDAKEAHEMDYDDKATTASSSKKEEPIVSEDEIVPSGWIKKEEDGFELKDLFFEDEDSSEEKS